MMQHYTAFGLSVDADLPLPELAECVRHAPADVAVHRGDLGAPPPAGALNDQHRFVRVADREIYVYWDFIGAVLVRKGCEIVYDPLPDVEESAVRSVLVGIALGLLLHQRGLFGLHASAVAVEGGVAAFIGNKGMGKSTTAAALHGRGHPLVTDDVLALEPEAPGSAAVNVIPGFPQLKLWPGAVEAALGDDPETLPRLDPRSEKRARRLRDGFEKRVLPLRCIYVLDYSADQERPAQVTPMPLQEAFKALTAHSYAMRFVKEKAGPSHLRHCTRLVEQVPIRRLTRKPSLDCLAGVAGCVEEDVARHIVEGGAPASSRSPSGRQGPGAAASARAALVGVAP